jgi:mitochondrial fission protein ELM1
VLLVGGTSHEHTVDEATARKLGQAVAAFARQAGGSVVAVTSPRTGAAATAALEEGIGAAGRVHRWRAEDNPYLAYMAGADAIVVTSDSEAMLSEAMTTGKPVYLYEVPRRGLGPVRLATRWITARAYSRRRKKKGTIRPQQGLEYLCSRLIERGFVLPPRDLRILHRELYERGLVRPFGEPLDLESPVRPLDELGVVVDRVKRMMGWSAELPVRVVSKRDVMTIEEPVASSASLTGSR